MGAVCRARHVDALLHEHLNGERIWEHPQIAFLRGVVDAIHVAINIGKGSTQAGREELERRAQGEDVHQPGQRRFAAQPAAVARAGIAEEVKKPVKAVDGQQVALEAVDRQVALRA